MIQKQNDQHNVLNQQPQTRIIQSQKAHQMDQKHNHSTLYILLIILLTILLVVFSFHTFFGIDFDQNELQSDLEQSDGFNFTTLHSESQLEQIIERMSTRPTQKLRQKNIKKLKPTKQAYFAFRLHQEPNNPNYIEAQSYYFNKKYQTQKYSSSQLPLCIVSSGRNVVYQNRYQRYINSLARQQYNNFKVVIIDDYSSDESVKAIKKYLQLNQMAQLSLRTTVISNQKRQYALYNRDLAIMQYCSSDSIIVELDTDDELIGRQVFKTINAVYSKEPEIWAMYSSYIYWSPNFGQPTQGISAKIPTKILQEGTYRLTTEWYTSATRTFRRKLYQKINKNDFKDQDGNFYKWTSDLFVHYSLIEMAGLQHYKYIHEIFYYYYLDHNSFAASEKAISRFDALSIKRYKLLKSLEQKVERIQDGQNQDWIKKQKERQIEKLKREKN